MAPKGATPEEDGDHNLSIAVRANLVAEQLDKQPVERRCYYDRSAKDSKAKDRKTRG
jgi:hypothetical protein